MANYFTVTLDTTGPSNVVANIDGGATYATQQTVNVGITTSDSTTTGYQMKIWGDVDTIYNSYIQATEAASTWMTYSNSQQVKLSNGDGAKNISVKLRDDVFNESAIATDSIILDTTLPIVSITGQDVLKISKQPGKNVVSFGFTVDTPFIEYKVKFVSSTGAAQDTGVQIGTTNGSTNMSGVKGTGTYAANTVINCTINGTDLEIANSGDTAKIIKVFVKDESGQWSV